MPVDLSISNAIINAFQAGREEKLKREELKLKKEREQEEKRQFDETLKERQKQFKELEDRRKAEFEATNKIAQGTAALQRLKGLSDITASLEAGRSVPGVERIATAKLGESQQNTFRLPEALGGDVFAARDPMTAARQTSQIQEELLKPKTKAQIQVEQAKELGDFQRQTLLQQQQFENQKILRTITEDARERLEKYRQGQANYRAGLKSKSGASNTAARVIATAHDNNALTKRAIVAKESINFINALDINTKSPSDDIGLIYAFAKAMDPDSVVREGEYATVQKYSQSWKDRFGFTAKRVLNNSEFLTPQARANLKSTIQARTGATLKEYNKYRSNIVNRINKAGGGIEGSNFLGEDPGTIEVRRGPDGKLQ